MNNILEVVDKQEFYPFYLEMCEKLEFPAMPIECIDTVLVYCKDEMVTHSCFLYRTGCDMCLVGFPQANPFTSYEFREGCLSEMFKEVAKYCKQEGYSLIWTISGTKRVINSLEETGFIVGDEGINQYYKILN